MAYLPDGTRFKKKQRRSVERGELKLFGRIILWVIANPQSKNYLRIAEEKQMYNTKAFYRHDAFIGSNRYNQFISSIGDKVTSGCMYGALKFLNEISEYSMTRYEGRYDDILSMDHRKNYEKRKKVILCAAKACLSENDIFKQIPLRKSPDTLAHDILNCIYQMCIGKFMGDLIYGMKDDEKKQIVEKLDKMIAEKISSPKDRYTNLDKLMDNIWTMFLWTCNTEL